MVVGPPRLLAERGLPLSSDLERAVDAARADGGTAVAVGWDGAARGVLVVADAVKDDLRRGRRAGCGRSG